MRIPRQQKRSALVLIAALVLATVCRGGQAHAGSIQVLSCHASRQDVCNTSYAVYHLSKFHTTPEGHTMAWYSREGEVIGHDVDLNTALNLSDHLSCGWFWLSTCAVELEVTSAGFTGWRDISIRWSGAIKEHQDLFYSPLSICRNIFCQRVWLLLL
ncbi:hypothetical protein [Reticulibacter mediterranei]|uniref:hypothetical protein n=1 Tax=Reticulibacter mediterranei TaxID=2778369 RepID=UPI001C68B1A6|nr:hypothetical protein [Reticulibacter mediterranei]